MKRIVLIIGLCVLSISQGLTRNQVEKPYKIFLLAGQSNMDGCGRSEELPNACKVHPDNIVTWDNRTKVWVQQPQERVATGDADVHIINTDKLATLEDTAHFNTKAQLQPGKTMARIMILEITE